MIRQCDGKKAEYQRLRRAPEPDVLMQQIERNDRKGEDNLCHKRFERTTITIILRSNFNAECEGD